MKHGQEMTLAGEENHEVLLCSEIPRTPSSCTSSASPSWSCFLHISMFINITMLPGLRSQGAWRADGHSRGLEGLTAALPWWSTGKWEYLQKKYQQVDVNFRLLLGEQPEWPSDTFKPVLSHNLRGMVWPYKTV